MPRKCSVCAHPEVDAINQALVSGQSYRNIAERFGLAMSSVYRHKSEHLPNALIKAAEAEQVASADDLLRQIRELHAEAMDVLNRNKGKDDKLVLNAIKTADTNLELLAKLLGKLDTSPKVAVLVTSPEWIAVRTAILLALEPYPDARQAVVNGLRELAA